MTSMFRFVALAAWVLGLIALLMSVVTKALHLAIRVRVEPSTFLLAATALFLCAIATRAVGKP